MAVRRPPLVLNVLLTLGAACVAACSRPDSVARATSSRVSTDHLNITASVRTDRRGAYFLVLDLDPRERIRVYAPSSAEDHGITVTTEPTPFLHLQPATFSTPERLNLAPDNEVAVYRKPFRVPIEALPANSEVLQASKGVVVRGVLRYQACNDKVCFPPASVPLSWTLAVRPH